MSDTTPTPVPSEVAETTAGEREVEALLYAHREDALTCYDHPEAYCCVCGAHEVGGYRSHLARTIAALLDRVRREEGAKVLREAAGRTYSEGIAAWLRDRADQIDHA